jgi:hypothetical protein
MPFTNWTKRLEIAEKYQTVKERAAAAAALKINFLLPSTDDEGYYRKPITEPVLGADGKTNGQKRVIGFEPVAYFIVDGMHGKALAGTIGKRRMTHDELTDESLWSWVVNRPVKYEWWNAVAREGKEWPDLAKIAEMQAAVPAANREVSKTDNQPEDDRPLDVQHREAIENAVRAAKDLEIKDEASAGVLLGMKNRIAELRLAAFKAGKAIYDPLFAVYKAEQKKWPPMVELAETMEKALDRKYLIWRAEEKKKADEAAAKAAAEAAAIEEANARAADRAIAQGIAEPAPAVPEASPEAAAAQTPVTPTYRASGQRTKPKEVEKWHLDGIDDQDKVYAFFKDNADVKAALLKVTTAAIVNGQEVPGTRRHFGLV